ncbi:hypothetical protein [Sphingobacterium deserti]|uniref:DUF1648 domain-containing protein n=1 Tax=Sphingobacterium deserti TaxID=1229276 RepID=A0A0B8T9B2_9SPHI|nr:hypothetical protein [Sphingobacterium deserti]KGE15304.1 hypothetical protein DI53_0985 [Sphingobacterium deserti]
MSKKLIYLYVIAVLILIFSVLLLARHHDAISSPVTTHINLVGEVDKIGDKVHLIYALCANGGLLLISLFFVLKPQYANYPFEITDENRASSYQKMRFFLLILCIITSISFNYMILKAINASHLFIYVISSTAFFAFMVSRYCGTVRS